MKIIQSGNFQLYDVAVWRNPYNRQHEVDPFFASTYIVKWKDDRFFHSEEFTADIAWDKASGIYVLGDKKSILKAFDTIKEYLIKYLDEDCACPYRFTLFQSLSDDMALIIGDGIYEHLESGFFELLNATGCSWDGIGIHGGNCSAIESIMSYSTDDCDESLKIKLIERFETYRKFPVRRIKAENI
jgi:hypothetical protein